MSLTIYGEISSRPLVHTNDPSGTVLYGKMYIFILGNNRFSPNIDADKRGIFLVGSKHYIGRTSLDDVQAFKGGVFDNK